MEDLENKLLALTENHHLRELHDVRQEGEGVISKEGRKLINLSGNDYLGIASNKLLLKEFYEEALENDLSISHYGLSASSSRLLSGNHPAYSAYEEQLKEYYNKDGALLFNSGYHANLGILPALLEKRDLIVSDKLNHASLIDGFRLSDADFVRYRHLDYDHLRKLLQQKRSDYNKIIIVTESIFSMDGDCADLQVLVQIKKEFDCLLYVDEAHAIGCRGENGLGFAEEQMVISDIDIIVAPLGKAMASQGAFAVMSKSIQDWLVNRMRPFIFTTALPPVTVHWNSFVLEKVKGMNNERIKLQELSKIFVNGLKEIGVQQQYNTCIVPLIVGENERAVHIAKGLEEEGVLVFPIRTPTVPPNTARLRFSLHSKISSEELTKTIKQIHKLYHY
ncbi:aminotransferase class I/II-fold pyridoxal phosphate-dependent enzyme [Sediminitomix flava]|uniref:8-amino-7-oxononanoate synthase n=1 Tax=Sediminitomix flava TaxID=379075 RepID=A0A315ZH17_SEDFL|nr:8-amino-7-oxononanoate synthase [Sediminitomix flava]PWJ44876.1 8-amino-7-oxononanoate synthase [Sediminitomix flava]